jgi:antitoxin component of MazEF toxin-antitoxin module
VSIIRKLRRVGNSLVVSLPPEAVSEAGFKEGTDVVITSRPGHVDLDRAGMPDRQLADFTSRFTEHYRKDLAELADR